MGRMLPGQQAVWYEDAAQILGVDKEQILEHSKHKVCLKSDLLRICQEMSLGQAARERLEKALPGERGRG